MTITDEQQKRINVIKEQLKAKRRSVYGQQEKLYQLSGVVDSLRNSNGNIHNSSGVKYVEGSIEYLESCLKENNLQPHILTDDERKGREC